MDKEAALAELKEMGFDSVAAFNSELVSEMENSPPESFQKQASAGGGTFIRKRIRENGFQRNIISLDPVEDSDFDRQVNTDKPVIVEDMEPDTPAAKAIPFNDGPDTAFYRGRRFEVRFAKITTREYTKNVDELRTYKMDLRQVMTDNGLKDMETEEDGRLINTVDQIVGSATGVGASGVQQNFEVVGRITRKTYKNIIKNLQRMDLNNGVFLINRETAVEFLGWGRDEEGGDRAQDMAQEGLRGMGKFVRFGVPHLATIKRLMVPDNVVYQFSEQEYLGKGYQLQEPTMFVEKKKDILRFCAQEKLGFTIGNVRAVARTLFTG